VIRSETRGPVVVATIDRPERRNAVDRATLDGLAGVLAAVAEGAEGDGGDGGVRALVLTGAGGHFCAGADLGGVEDEAFGAALRGVLDGLRLAPCVTIAAVDGAALGAGTQLAVACDLRVATPGARFGIPAGKLGLAVDAWTVDRLALLAGAGPARAMLLAAEVLSGEEAQRIGLVQRLGGLDDALAWVDDIAALAPLTLRAHKAALEQPADAPAASARAWASADLQEGLAAFRERRQPRFLGH
jgi:enoyl-CoA hydratase